MGVGFIWLAAVLVKVHGVLVLGLCLIAGQVICAELIELLGPSAHVGIVGVVAGVLTVDRRPGGPAPAAGGTPHRARLDYLISEIYSGGTMSERDDYLARIGTLIRDARQHSGLTQAQLATELKTSQSAVNRIEQGQQNLTLEMLARIGSALDSELVSVGTSGPSHLRVRGGTTLSGSIDVKSSKNAGVALLCASLLNEGTTVLRKVARIEEVNRLLEVLESIGVRFRWLNSDNDLELVVPSELDLAAMDADAARRTRSIIMFLGPLMHRVDHFELPYAGGCDLGTRTVEPHMTALRPFGLKVVATEGSYHAAAAKGVGPERPIVLTERGDTVTENALLAAARYDGVTVIRNASPNYMVHPGQPRPAVQYVPLASQTGPEVFGTSSSDAPFDHQYLDLDHGLVVMARSGTHSTSKEARRSACRSTAPSH